MEIFNPFARPLYVMLKPAGSLCNLRCKYCYYLEKQKLYSNCKNQIITDSMLEKFIKEYIEAQTSPSVLFTWHGGETLMRPIAFYKKALELQRIYARGRYIDNCIQTNGTLLTPEWCRFFKENGFLVGVSIDGPQEFHDEYRRSATNQPTFYKVMRGIDLLNKYGVEWNALAVVNDFNADYPLDFYHFFKEIGCHYIQFSPIVERNVERADGLHLAPGMQEGGELIDFSITPEQWGNFLCTIFDEWVRHDVGEYYIQLFDATLANWVGEAPRSVHSRQRVRPRRRYGAQWRRVFVRPLRISRTSARQPSRQDHHRNDVFAQAERICQDEKPYAATAMQRMQLPFRVQRRVPQKPLRTRPLRQPRSQLPLPRLSPLLRARSPLHGFHG